MHIPFSMLQGPSGGKSTALMAVLAGLVILTALKNRTQSPAAQQVRSPL